MKFESYYLSWKGQWKLEINQNQFWHTFNLCGVTFDAKCGDAFQLQLHFFKFISTFQLQLELSNCRVIFKLQKKISNFARLFPTSLDYFQLGQKFSNSTIVSTTRIPLAFQCYYVFNVVSVWKIFGVYQRNKKGKRITNVSIFFDFLVLLRASQ